jgi:S1-C subfamily serine protease
LPEPGQINRLLVYFASRLYSNMELWKYGGGEIMFTDLPTDHMFYADIMRHVKLGLISGYQDGTVKPDEPLTLGRYCAIQSRKMFRDRVEKDVLERVAPALTAIFAKLPDGKVSQGSGFFIGPRTIVTNEHVVKDGVSFDAYFNGGQWPVTLKVLPDPSFKQDIAILEAPVYNPTWFKLRETPIYQGMHVGVLGAPIGLLNTYTSGVVSNVSREGWTGNLDWFQTDAAINPGNSGGPIIDGRGDVVGVSVAKVSAVGIEGIAYGIKDEKLKEFCQRMGVILGA